MTDFTSKQYKKVLEANKRRNEIPTMAWTPLDKECVHTQLFKAQEVRIDLAEEAENEILKSTGKLDTSKHFKRPPPMPPKSPYE